MAVLIQIASKDLTMTTSEIDRHLNAVVLHVHDRAAIGVHLGIGGRVERIVLESRRNRDTVRVVRRADSSVRLGGLVRRHPIIVALLIVGGVDIVGNALFPVDHEHLGLARSPGCLQGVVLDRLLAEVKTLAGFSVDPSSEVVASLRGLGLLRLRSG